MKRARRDDGVKGRGRGGSHSTHTALPPLIRHCDGVSLVGVDESWINE